ncbi:MAG TPA: hypothetical protein VKA70_04895 [Blastocatellia bacterium]|nr:hypothetical protein [Blastocatellia bacterium]
MHKRSIKQLFSISLVAVALLCGLFDTSAHHAVVRVNLEEMTALAESVFMGRCINVEETRDMIAGGDLPVTRYTFEVERAIKGKVAKQVTFTQVGHAPRRAGKGGGLVSNGMRIKGGSFLHGASAYKVGDEVVLFLNPINEGTKVSSPVGHYQGAFFISRMPSGQKMLRNSINNLGLFTTRYTGAKMSAGSARVVFPDRDNPVIAGGETASLARKRGSLPLEEFLNLVEQINTAHGGERGVIADNKNGKGAILQ